MIRWTELFILALGIRCSLAAHAPDCRTTPCGQGQCTMSSPGQYTCDCNAGWSGEQCTVQVNSPPCTPSPCQHGGVCTDISSEFANSYKCQCQMGYTGRQCQDVTTTATTCTSTLCNNQGTCEQNPQTNLVFCRCNSGFTGPTCSLSVTNPCAGNPCGAGNLCTRDNDFPYYACPVSFIRNACLPNPCSAGQTCSLTTTAPFYTCTNACTNVNCNNGQCVLSGSTPSCVCNSGWTGSTCNIAIDLCASVSCGNGQCNVVNGVATCQCNPGWTGSTCTTQITTTNPCAAASNPCGPGFTCLPISDPPNFICSRCTSTNNPCESGFTCTANVVGPNFYSCTAISSPCSTSNPCPSGRTCVSTSTTPFYACSLCSSTSNPCETGSSCTASSTPPYYTCSVDTDLCSNITCTEGYVCKITEGTSGPVPNCQEETANPCSNVVCINGQCAVDNGLARCLCNAGYTGPTCGTPLSQCTDTSCNGNGVCTPAGSSFTCTCNNGYTGTRCETATVCAAVECGAMQTCRVTENGYICVGGSAAVRVSLATMILAIISMLLTQF